LNKELAKLFPKAMLTRRPIKISPFKNTARRRSYALKTHFVRRVGYDQTKKCEDGVRKCRNTSRDKLRAKDSLECPVSGSDWLGVQTFLSRCEAPQQFEAGSAAEGGVMRRIKVMRELGAFTKEK
jgi:hypothetical protein